MKWMGKVIKLGGALLAVALAVAAGGASAQMYTWKDAKGVTHFSDQPPPEAAGAKAGAVATRAAPRGPSQPSLPYALAEAVKRQSGSAVHHRPVRSMRPGPHPVAAARRALP